MRRRVALLNTGGRWEELTGEIDRHEQLASELSPVYEAHNELEIMRIRAGYNLTGDVVAQMYATLRCARDSGATNAHRLHAAKECAKASEVSSTETLRAVVKVARTIAKSSPNEMWDAQMIEWIYHLRVGDVQEAVRLAEGLEALVERGCERTVNSLIARGICYSVAGRLSDTRASFIEAIRLSRGMGLSNSLAIAYDYLIGFSLDFDGSAVTKTILNEAWNSIGAVIATVGVGGDLIFPSHQAQLAIMEGDVPLARKWAVPVDRRIQLAPVRWKARLVAIHVAIALELDELERASTIAAHMNRCFDEPDFWLDWPASVYARFLDRVNPDEATRFAKRFVETIRRELYPATHGLLELANRQLTKPLALT
jgi:hypothetical protein